MESAAFWGQSHKTNVFHSHTYIQKHSQTDNDRNEKIWFRTEKRKTAQIVGMDLFARPYP